MEMNGIRWIAIARTFTVRLLSLEPETGRDNGIKTECRSILAGWTPTRRPIEVEGGRQSATVVL